MRYESIADIYSANRKIRERLARTLAAVSDDEAKELPEGEKWSIAQIVEHLAIVEHGTSRICAKLLNSASSEGRTSDGTFLLTRGFGEKAVEIDGMRVEAPERVHPTGNLSILQSMERLKTSTSAFDALRPGLEQYDLSAHKFPHPFFGDLTAAEWLVMVGWHEQRHHKQIESLLGRIRQEKAPG